MWGCPAFVRCAAVVVSLTCTEALHAAFNTSNEPAGNHYYSVLRLLTGFAVAALIDL